MRKESGVPLGMRRQLLLSLHSSHSFYVDVPTAHTHLITTSYTSRWNGWLPISRAYGTLQTPLFPSTPLYAPSTPLYAHLCPSTPLYALSLNFSDKTTAAWNIILERETIKKKALGQTKQRSRPPTPYVRGLQTYGFCDTTHWDRWSKA